MLASYGATGVVWLETGKTPTDHAISAVREEDCSLVRALRSEAICRAPAPVGMAVADAGTDDMTPTATPTAIASPRRLTDQSQRSDPMVTDRVTVAELPPIVPAASTTTVLMHGPTVASAEPGRAVVQPTRTAIGIDRPPALGAPAVADSMAGLAPVPHPRRVRDAPSPASLAVADIAVPLPPRRPGMTAAGEVVPLPPGLPQHRRGLRRVQLAEMPGG